MDGLFWLSYDPDPVVLSLFLYQHSVQSFSSIITLLILFVSHHARLSEGKYVFDSNCFGSMVWNHRISASDYL